MIKQVGTWKIRWTVLALGLGLFITAATLTDAQDSEPKAKTLEELQAQVELLQKELKQLKEKRDTPQLAHATQPTYTAQPGYQMAPIPNSGAEDPSSRRITLSSDGNQMRTTVQSPIAPRASVLASAPADPYQSLDHVIKKGEALSFEEPSLNLQQVPSTTDNKFQFELLHMQVMERQQVVQVGNESKVISYFVHIPAVETRTVEVSDKLIFTSETPEANPYKITLSEFKNMGETFRVVFVHSKTIYEGIGIKNPKRGVDGAEFTIVLLNEEIVGGQKRDITDKKWTLNAKIGVPNSKTHPRLTLTLLNVNTELVPFDSKMEFITEPFDKI